MRLRRGLALALVAASAACGDDPRLPPSAAGCRRALAGGAGEAPAAGSALAASLTWRIVSDDEGRRALDAFCAGVGPAVLWAPAGEAPPAGDALALVAWNIERGFGDVAALVEDLRAGRLTGGEPVGDFVLLLQEATRSGESVPVTDALPAGVGYGGWDETGGPDVPALARSLGLHLLYVPSMRNGLRPDTREDEGSAILSTLPITGAAALELPFGAQRRVAVAGTVPWPRGAAAGLRVASVHLDNASARKPLASLGRMRARQARGLVRLLPSQGPLVVGGDLNTWVLGAREAAARILRAALPRPPELPPGATARRLGVPRRLDYLLLRAPPAWRFESRRAASRYGSDHSPVVGVLRVR